MKSIAIVGLGRSGTTWISKLFDSNPDVVYLHEPDYIERIPCVPYTTDVDCHLVWEPFIRQYIDGLPSLCTARSMLKRPAFKKNYSKTTIDKFNTGIFCLRLRAKQFGNRLGFSEKPTLFPRQFKDAKALVWKSVEQTGNIGCILHAVPEQKLIHVVRHPCGFVDSVLRGEKRKLLQGGVPMSGDPGIFDFVAKTKVAQSLGIRLCDWLSIKTHERLAFAWLCLNEQAAIDGSSRRNYKLMYFDRFCMSPQDEAKAAFEFSGIEFTTETESFVRSSSSEDSQVYFDVNRQSSKVPKSWEKNLSRDEIDRVFSIAKLGDRMSDIIAFESGGCVSRREF